jgi:hypothetical protein
VGETAASDAAKARQVGESAATEAKRALHALRDLDYHPVVQALKQENASLRKIIDALVTRVDALESAPQAAAASEPAAPPPPPPTTTTSVASPSNMQRHSRSTSLSSAAPATSVSEKRAREPSPAQSGSEEELAPRSAGARGSHRTKRLRLQPLESDDDDEINDDGNDAPPEPRRLSIEPNSGLSSVDTVEVPTLRASASRASVSRASASSSRTQTPARNVMRPRSQWRD